MKPGSWLRRRPPLAETAADFGPLARPLDQDDDRWDCPHCGESNFADGHKQCWQCLLAAPWVDPADDPVHHAIHGLVYLTDDGSWRPA